MVVEDLIFSAICPETFIKCDQVPILQTWNNINPTMDK